MKTAIPSCVDYIERQPAAIRHVRRCRHLLSGCKMPPSSGRTQIRRSHGRKPTKAPESEAIDRAVTSHCRSPHPGVIRGHPSGESVREIAGAWKGWTSSDKWIASGATFASPPAVMCAWETELQQFRANGSRLYCISAVIYFVNA